MGFPSNFAVKLAGATSSETPSSSRATSSLSELLASSRVKPAGKELWQTSPSAVLCSTCSEGASLPEAKASLEQVLFSYAQKRGWGMKSDSSER